MLPTPAAEPAQAPKFRSDEWDRAVSETKRFLPNPPTSSHRSFLCAAASALPAAAPAVLMQSRRGRSFRRVRVVSEPTVLVFVVPTQCRCVRRSWLLTSSAWSSPSRRRATPDEEGPSLNLAYEFGAPALSR